mmetsp:Transcript_1110/g.2460  ORF Transcript_1110/g.2460 Transcript_1110/m.2460 type:complete len:254 (-) Transcript_1110:257-1018(-)
MHNLGVTLAHDLGRHLGYTIKGNGLRILDIVHFASRNMFPINDIGHGDGQIFHVSKAREMLSMSWNTYGSIVVNAFKKVPFHGVVVARTTNVGGTEGTERYAQGSQTIFRIQFSLVTTLRVHGVSFQMGHFFRLEINTRAAHKDVLFQVGSDKEFGQRTGVRFFARIHVKDVVVLGRINLGTQLFRILAIALDKICQSQTILEIFFRFFGDGSRWRLGTVVTRDGVSATVEFFPQGGSRESSATNDEHTVGGC